MTSEHDDIQIGGDAGASAEGRGRDRRVRRSRLTVVGVAAAVLLAGGGGTWWAVAANSGGSPRPAPLVLNGGAQAGGSGGPDRSGSTSSGGSPGSSIAIGENGTYTLAGTLPDGPSHAAVYRPAGGVGQDKVLKLAALLGVPGPVVLENDSWRVGSPPGTPGPALLVSLQAPGIWTYTRDAAPKPLFPGESGQGGSAPGSAGSTGRHMMPGADSGSGNSTDPNGDLGHTETLTSPSPGASPGSATASTSGSERAPVSEQKARQAVGPLLDGLGLSGARVDASATLGSLRLVTADPVVDGLPTRGWSTQLQVGPDGTLTRGYGRLAPLLKGATYPVISARAALDRLNSQGVVDTPGHHFLGCGAHRAGPTPTATYPGEDKTLPHVLPCGVGRASIGQVRGAEFGLSLRFSGGDQILVPAWLFQVRPNGATGSGVSVVTETAVEPSLITARPPAGGAPEDTPPRAPLPVSPGGPVTTDPQMPVDPQSPGHTTVTGFRAAGTALTVTFWGGVCSTYQVATAETSSQVRVDVTATPTHPGSVCPMVIRSFSRTVQLAHPLGQRSVVDAVTGRPVRGQ